MPILAMTGKGHRLTGLGAAFMAGALALVTGLPEIPAAVMAAGMTTAPDWLEIPLYRGGIRAGSLIPHRTITHWPYLWLALIVWGVAEGGLIGSLSVGGAVGCLVHILGDAPNPMGIPWLWPTRRIRLGKRGWWRSGDHEFLLVLWFAAVGFGLWRLAGGGFPW